MNKFSIVARALDAGVHATHSGMVIEHDFHDIVLGHLSVEVVLAAYVLIRLGMELVKLLIRGCRAIRKRREKDCTIDTAQPNQVVDQAG